MRLDRLTRLVPVLMLLVIPFANALAYDRATITNKTIFLAHVEVNYPGCKNDKFSVPAGTLNPDGSTITPGKATAPTKRGGCLISWISATLDGAGKSVSKYKSSGTGYSQFVIQGTQQDFRVYSDHELKAETASIEGKSPGFYITNNTRWPVSVSLAQVSCLYYGTLKPGESFNRHTGAVWFTINARISPDGKELLTDKDCIMPVAEIVGGILLAAATGGAGAFAALPAAGTAAAALAPLTMSTVMVVTGGAVLAAGTATATASAVMIGKALAATGEGSLKGQYAGPDWPFRCDQKPTYVITGGWGAPAGDTQGNFGIDPGTPLKISKTNGCGNGMMR